MGCWRRAAQGRRQLEGSPPGLRGGKPLSSCTTQLWYLLRQPQETSTGRERRLAVWRDGAERLCVLLFTRPHSLRAPRRVIHPKQFPDAEAVGSLLYFVVDFQLLSRSYSATPMDFSAPGLPILLCLPELAQTHVHCVHDAIQPSHPLLSPSPPALSLSQASGSFPMSQFFTLVTQVLELQLQYQSFQ